MLTVLLLLSVFLVFYAVTGGSLPEVSVLRSMAFRFGLPAACAAGCFALTAALFQSPLAGIFWGLLGWFLPGWMVGLVQARELGPAQGIGRGLHYLRRRFVFGRPGHAGGCPYHG
ncbi:MAG: hypothetical protein ACOY40_09625 [Bacillota bacterium]